MKHAQTVDIWLVSRSKSSSFCCRARERRPQLKTIFFAKAAGEHVKLIGYVLVIEVLLLVRRQQGTPTVASGSPDPRYQNGPGRTGVGTGGASAPNEIIGEQVIHPALPFFCTFKIFW